jgi:hypothetical protein
MLYRLFTKSARSTDPENIDPERTLPGVLAFVDGSGFARGNLSAFDRSRLRSFVRPVLAVRVTAVPDEVRMPGPNQTKEL